MAKELGSSNKEKGADFGRGTRSIKAEDYTKIQEGTAPAAQTSDGKPMIVDKTS